MSNRFWDMVRRRQWLIRRNRKKSRLLKKEYLQTHPQTEPEVHDLFKEEEE